MKGKALLRMAAIAAAGGILLALALFGAGRPGTPVEAQNAAPPPVAVEVVTPERRDLVRQIRLPGTVRPWEETQLYAKVSGYLRQILVDKGDVVKGGQLLAVLDVPEMGDDLAQQRAQAEAARMRSREPVAAVATAHAEVDRAESEVGAARAALEAARAELEATRAAAQEPESLLAGVRAEEAVARAAAEEPGREVETARATLRAAQADLQAAEAEVARYQADYELREKTYRRYNTLCDRGVVTEQERDQTEGAYKAAKAALNTAETRVSAMKERVVAAQSAVRTWQAKVTTAEARTAAPEAQVPNIEAKGRTARARVTTAEKAVGSAQSAVHAAEARVEVARRQLREVEARVASAHVEVAAAAAGAQKVRTLMQYRRLTAPYDGVVTARNVDPGQLIQTSVSSQVRPLLVVSHIDRVRVIVAVPQTDVTHLRVGRGVTLTVHEFPGRTWSGTVTRYTNDLDPQARTMTAEIDLPNPGWALRPGMYADVAVNLETHARAFTVPSSAVVAEKQVRSLWVARDGKAEKIPVKVGVDNGVEAEILAGIGAEEQVIASGQSSLKAGQAVRAVPARHWSAGAAAP
ncbi:MAG: efflux RND transporter periplasmic adaptor subunit [Armatimonadetes bacterium]|nr:efflux RND transporter periplasmic adaptor subunit [Armatimonadota bacterium]